jgi:hypothetical protein
MRISSGRDFREATLTKTDSGWSRKTRREVTMTNKETGLKSNLRMKEKGEVTERKRGQ